MVSVPLGIFSSELPRRAIFFFGGAFDSRRPVFLCSRQRCSAGVMSRKLELDVWLMVNCGEPTGQGQEPDQFALASLSVRGAQLVAKFDLSNAGNQWRGHRGQTEAVGSPLRGTLNSRGAGAGGQATLLSGLAYLAAGRPANENMGVACFRVLERSRYPPRISPNRNSEAPSLQKFVMAASV